LRLPIAPVSPFSPLAHGRSSRTAAHFKIPTATDDWPSIVARPDVDVIDASPPSATHLELSTAALHSGKLVL
jgi:predicted dehydrogenase